MPGFDKGLKSSLLYRFYHDLREHFGTQRWWPAESPWEVAVGAILTQNTNWRNVEKAIDNLKIRRMLTPEAIHDLDSMELAELIRPSGYFRLKMKRLKNLAAWWLEHADNAFAKKYTAAELRRQLLRINGVGQETADSILLYAFEKKQFVVDAYTRRFLTRHGMLKMSVTYSEIQQYLEKQMPADIELYKDYHALIVTLGKKYCRPDPLCHHCPLRWHLSKIDIVEEK